MKWKITSRYVFSVIGIFFILFLFNIILLRLAIYYQEQKDFAVFVEENYEKYARSFTNYIQIDDNNEFSLSKEGEEQLSKQNAWLQILDDNGSEIAAFHKPEHISTHYNIFDIMHKYKYLDNDLNLYLIGQIEDFSYIVGVQDIRVNRYVHIIDLKYTTTNLIKFLLIVGLTNLIILIIIGLLLSNIFTAPLYRIMDRIRAFKNRVFQKDENETPGVFKEVFSNLNNVAETLDKHEKERNQLEKMRNEWITNISHDIKTPLASIVGFSDLLRGLDKSCENHDQYIDIIQNQAEYIQSLLEDFNLTQRLRNEEIALQLENTNISVFIRELLIDILNNPQFQYANIMYECMDENIWWEIDQHLIKRALLNFIHNALIHNDQVDIKVIVTKNSIIIQDNGKGIPQEDQKQIFDRYYRGTNTQQNSRGTGLGLAIARDIIYAHGATLELASELGQGTQITIKI